MPRTNFPLLSRYMADWRSLFPGGAAGVMQLMLPPLGAAVEQHSNFFADPFARIYRSIPQIWATVLTHEGERRGLHIRDLHRTINGKFAGRKTYRALNPETFWWAHATFTWEVFESIRLFHAGGLDKVDEEALYAETVAWYGLYGVSTRPVPPTYEAFKKKFAEICLNKLEMTPSASHTLEMAYAGDWRLPLSRRNSRLWIVREAGRIVILNTFPKEISERFSIRTSERDRQVFSLLCWMGRVGFGLLPRIFNRAGVVFFLRYLGRKTKPQRFNPEA